MINPFTPFGFNSVQNDIKNEISSYLQTHEPPIEHQIMRCLMSSEDIDINKIRKEYIIYITKYSQEEAKLRLQNLTIDENISKNNECRI